MDSKVKRIVILLTSLTILAVLAIVLVANRRTISRMTGSRTSISESSVKETAPFKGDLSAWKSDESFFDADNTTLAGRILEEMKTLSVSAFSVERDLRIQILDYEGNLSKGNDFELEIRNTGSSGAGSSFAVRDEDKDGLVLLKDLIPGEYEVTLMPAEGFNVPDRALKITVKEKLDYSLIEDISLDIRHEQADEPRPQMDISAFDSAAKQVRSDIVKDMKIGVDLSSEDGEVDFVKFYDAGIRFVMLRAGYRDPSTGEIIADDMFITNARKALTSGLDVGAYFFSQAVSEREAVEEASATLVIASGAIITYPICIREDRAGGTGRADELDEKRRTDYADAFCRTIANEGLEPAVYASGSWLSTNLEAGRLEKYKIWLADYHSAPEYEGYYDLWQYTGTGKVPGMDHEAGLTISYMKESE
ncbi:MAG: hypothetical protein K6E19_09525 [Lachnospiraceae bacterium]|nr:hypothetical protein [Lachnospiraceae bacterium]